MNRDIKKIVYITLLAISVATVFESTAYANIGVPMLAVVWPVSWLLLLPIIFIEAKIACNIANLPFKRGTISSVWANCISSLVGIPLCWGAMLAIQFVIPDGNSGRGLATFGDRLFAVTVQSPWLVPYKSEMYWMIPAASAFLLIPFFLISVYIERWVFKKASGCSLEVASRWAWLANGVTYGGIFSLLIILVLVSFLWQ